MMTSGPEENIDTIQCVNIEQLKLLKLPLRFKSLRNTHNNRKKHKKTLLEKSPATGDTGDTSRCIATSYKGAAHVITLSP